MNLHIIFKELGVSKSDLMHLTGMSDRDVRIGMRGKNTIERITLENLAEEFLQPAKEKINKLKKQYMKKCILEYLKGKQIVNGIDLINHVKRKLKKPKMYHDSILRKLRLLREEGKVSYICIDNKKTIYKIIKINE